MGYLNNYHLWSRPQCIRWAMKAMCAESPVQKKLEIDADGRTQRKVDTYYTRARQTVSPDNPYYYTDATNTTLNIISLEWIIHCETKV